MPGTPTHPCLHVLLAGGGTGGHVVPALSVADELAARGHDVSFAGLATGIEARLVAARSYAFHALAARPLVGRGALARLGSLATLAGSAVAARSLVRRLGVHVVVGTGGYVSAPAVIGAKLAGRPALLLEPNARVGVANRWLSRLAREAFVAHASAQTEIACPSRLTGVPVRPAFFAVPELTLPAVPLRLLMLGGSQGARQLNDVLPAALARAAAALPGLAVVHQCGERHLEATRAAYAPAAGVPGLEVELVPFLDDVAGAMAASHLVISRAGALTLAEIAAAGRPAVLVPLAQALGHQVDNALALAEAGGARLLAADDATPERLAGTLVELLGNAGLLLAMAKAARGLARPEAATTIANRIEICGREVAA